MNKKKYTLIFASTEQSRLQGSFSFSSILFKICLFLFLFIIYFSIIGFLRVFNIDDSSAKIADLSEMNYKAIQLLDSLDDSTLIKSEEFLSSYLYNDSTIKIIPPVDGGYISKKIDDDISPHNGIDIVAKRGTDIKCPLDGIVVFVGEKGNLGNTLIISHPLGYFTIYGHNDKILVSEMEYVYQGDIISKLGSTGQTTGPHLHFEIWRNGKRINPITLINEYGEKDVSER